VACSLAAVVGRGALGTACRFGWGCALAERIALLLGAAGCATRRFVETGGSRCDTLVSPGGAWSVFSSSSD
jgi:hypothetical protein